MSNHRCSRTFGIFKGKTRESDLKIKLGESENEAGEESEEMSDIHKEGDRHSENQSLRKQRKVKFVVRKKGAKYTHKK